MKYYTYILYSESCKRLYIGQTDDLKKRVDQHLTGRVSSTKPFRPYKLIYYEEFVNRIDAIKREKELKMSKGRKYVKKFINNNLTDLLI